MKRPAWAESRSFSECWSAVEKQINSPAGSNMAVEGLAAILYGLQRARVVAIGREQVASLPLPELSGDTKAICHRVEETPLPFENLFLDLDSCGIGGDGDLRGRAALLTRGKAVNGWGWWFTAWIADTLPTADGGIGTCVPLSLLPGQDGNLQLLSQRMPRVDPTGVNTLAVTARSVLARVLAVTDWLQSFNVELVEAPLSPRQRERELKKGRQITLTVQVKQTKRYTSTSQTNGSANYSHRFETRGHYKHYFEFKPDGRASKVFERCYAKDPSRVVMVDGKECFRFWVPPYVKGPIDKPFVPKVRVVEEH